MSDYIQIRSPVGATLSAAVVFMLLVIAYYTSDQLFNHPTASPQPSASAFTRSLLQYNDHSSNNNDDAASSLAANCTDACAVHGPTLPTEQFYALQTNTCVGSPIRPNRPQRLSIPEMPLMYMHQPFMDHGSGVSAPTCWTQAKYEEWKAGKLVTYPMSKRTEQLVSHMMFSIVTGRVYHRQRADIIMCTYAQQVPYGQYWFHSDGDDDEKRLPLLGNVRSVDENGKEKQCDHSCSERKWVAGMNETLKLVRDDPSMHWLMVGDDDTFIALKHLADLTAQYDHDKPYLLGSVHYALDGVQGKHGLYGGAGFLISRQLALNILPHFHLCYGYQHSESDLFLSRCMVDFGDAVLVDRLEMGSQPPRYYIEQQDDCVEQIRPGLSKGATYHYVRPWQDYYYLYMMYLAFSD